MTTTAIDKAVTGGAAVVRNELSSLEIDGKVRYEAGSHNAKLWYPVDKG